MKALCSQIFNDTSLFWKTKSKDKDKFVANFVKEENSYFYFDFSNNSILTFSFFSSKKKACSRRSVMSLFDVHKSILCIH